MIDGEVESQTPYVREVEVQKIRCVRRAASRLGCHVDMGLVQDYGMNSDLESLASWG